MAPTPGFLPFSKETGRLSVGIESLTRSHWPEVAVIYAEGIDTGAATFETAVPSWEAWDESHLPRPRLVATRDQHIVAWAALSPVSRRAVYSGVAEVSIYVGKAFRSEGIGKTLLSALISESEGQGLWTLQAGILSANLPSIRLHQACGFRVVGTRERVGQLRGVWHDVVLLERRSKLIGVP